MGEVIGQESAARFLVRGIEKSRIDHWKYKDTWALLSIGCIANRFLKFRNEY